MNTPLQAKAGHPAARAQSHRTRRRSQDNGSPGGRRVPESPRGERLHAPQARLAEDVRARDAQGWRSQSPTGDEREGANLEQPDTGAAGGAPGGITSICSAPKALRCTDRAQIAASQTASDSITTTKRAPLNPDG
jgi:hypothetical protein